jgi:hypothetical protein
VAENLKIFIFAAKSRSGRNFLEEFVAGLYMVSNQDINFTMSIVKQLEAFCTRTQS